MIQAKLQSAIRGALLACSLLICGLVTQPLFAQEIPEIGYGQTVTGEISAAQGDVLYRFKANQADMITAMMEMLEGTLDPFLILLDEEQKQVLAVDNDSGGNRNARLRYIMPKTATFLIKATTPPNGGTGKFRLSLILNNPTPTPSPYANAPRLAPLQAEQQADLSENVSFAIYGFYALSSDKIAFDVEFASGLQAGLYLYNADFSEQLAAAELGQRLDVTTPAEGFYFLVVNRVSGSGAYTLRADFPTRLVALLPPENKLVPGQAQTGAIGPRFINLYHFDGRAGMQVGLDLTSDLPVVSILASADFKQVIAADGMIRNVVLPSSGRYYVLVARRGGLFDATTGAFSLTLNGSADPPPTPTSQPGPYVALIHYGDVVNGTITNQAPLFYYRFEGTQGEVVSARMEQAPGSALDPLLYLYAYEAAPRLIAGNDNLAPENQNAGIIEFQLPVTGPYLIIATRAGAAQGSTQGGFTLTLERVR